MNISISGGNVHIPGVTCPEIQGLANAAVLVFDSEEQRNAFVDIVRQRDWEFRFGEMEGER